LKDEDSLAAFLCKHFDDPGPLLSYIRSEYLTVSGISRILEYISPDNLNWHLWASLCRRLVLPVTIDISQSERFIVTTPPFETFEYFDNSPFSGIISCLTGSCGGNIHEKGIVAISSSGDQYRHCWEVANHGWKDYWYTTNRPNSWISFDFKIRSISLSSYTLKSHSGGGNFFISWTIEGSNDGTTWTMLDNRNTRDLAGKSIVGNFPCCSGNTSFFRHIRMRQTGKASSDAHNLILTNIEFFGRMM
jgi:hypothetical protein